MTGMLLFEGPPEVVALRLFAFGIAAAALVLMVVSITQFG
jgi:hypothetical protein